MATLFRFPLVSPQSYAMRNAAEASSVSFDYNSIVYYSTSYCGYSNIDPSDLTQSETDSLITEIENATGQPITGPFSVSDIESSN